jgi:hypothetical protein
MDEIDIANEQAEKILKFEVSFRKPAPKLLKHVGFCYNCGEPCHGAFCDDTEHDGGCQKDFELRSKVKQ